MELLGSCHPKLLSTFEKDIFKGLRFNGCFRFIIHHTIAFLVIDLFLMSDFIETGFLQLKESEEFLHLQKSPTLIF